MEWTRRAIEEALAVLLPVDCAGCGAVGRSVCAGCRTALAGEPSRREVAGVPVVSGCDYVGEVARMIVAFKDDGRVDAGAALAIPLARAVRAALAEAAPSASGPVLAVPIPGSRSAFRRRGYDPVRVLARRARIPLHPGLRLVRRVADQAGLSVDERAANRAGALRATRRVQGRSVLLVDDVVTTGSTLRDAVRAVETAGGVVVAAATAASTRRRYAAEVDPGVGRALLGTSQTSLGNTDDRGLGSGGQRR